jgi:hypothetical protein
MMMLRLNLKTQKPRQGQLKTVSMAISPRFGILRLGTHSMMPRLSPHDLLRGNYGIVGIPLIYKDACTRWFDRFYKKENVTASLNLIAAQAQASIAGDLVTASSMADLLQSLAAEQVPGNASRVPKPLADRKRFDRQNLQASLFVFLEVSRNLWRTAPALRVLQPMLGTFNHRARHLTRYFVTCDGSLSAYLQQFWQSPPTRRMVIWRQTAGLGSFRRVILAGVRREIVMTSESVVGVLSAVLQLSSASQ